MNNKTISISFDVQQLYYLPQYLPVYHRLLKQNAGHATFVFYHGIHDAIIENIIQSENLNYIWVKDKAEANEYYKNQKADWIFFGNTFPFLNEVHQISCTDLLIWCTSFKKGKVLPKNIQSAF